MDHQIAMLWMRGSLSFVEQLCVKSFLDAGHHVALAVAFAGARHLWDTQRAFPCLVPLDDLACALPHIALDDERVRVLKPFEGDAAPQDGM